MYDSKRTIGRKISPQGMVASLLRQRKKQIITQRKYFRRKKKRTKLQEKLLRQQRRIERALVIMERPTISLLEGNILFNDVRDSLIEMGYPEVYASGRLRRGMGTLKTITIVLCINAYNTTHNINPEEFVFQMAKREYLSVSLLTNDKYKGASNVFLVEQIPVIIHTVNPDNIGAALLYTTGNEMFLRVLAAHAMKNCKLQLRKTGVFMNGECIASVTEEDIFEALDLKYHSVEERTFIKGCYLQRLF